MTNVEIIPEDSSEYEDILENTEGSTPLGDFTIYFPSDAFTYSLVRYQGYTVLYPRYEDHQNNYTPVVFRGHPSVYDITTAYRELIEDDFID